MTPHTEEPRRSSTRDQVALLSRIEGSFAASVLFALLKLEIFDRIHEGHRTPEQLAAATGARGETLARLLNAGVAFGFLEADEEPAYRLAPVTAKVLVHSAGDAYIGDWLLNLDHFLQALTRLDAAVLEGAPVAGTSLSGDESGRTRAYLLAWHNYSAPRAKELADRLHMEGCRSMLDLGCGAGTYAFELGVRNPSVRLYLSDLPEALDVAKQVQSTYPLSNEVKYLPADATKDKIPGTYDLVLVSNTLHVLGHQASRQLIERLYSAINPGGSLVIQGQFLRDDHMGERWPVMVDLIQLCMTCTGENHSVAEARSWMEESGFVRVEHKRMTLLNTNSLIRGYRA